MRIGLDARLYGPIGKGVGRYSEKLIENLEKIDQQNEYFVFLSKENFAFYKPQNPNFHKVLAPYPWYSFREQFFFPRLLQKFRLDLVHFLHFNVPLFYPGKFLVTIHDLVHYLPRKQVLSRNRFIYWFKKIGYHLVIQHNVKRAEKVITVSHFSRDQILRFTTANPSKIKVIYEAADFPPRISKEKQEVEFLKEVPYLLYVGNAFPHKNLNRLLQAFKITHSFLDIPKLSLVLVGALDSYFKKLKEFSEQIGIDKSVIFTGRVNEAELKWLYEHALAYVFPSLIEGFGLPGLEAMAYGLPVVSSNAGPLPEIYSEAALYFNPEDIIDLAKKITRIVQGQNLREELIKKGFEQIKKYSWQKTAKETLEVYQSLLTGQS